MRHRAFRSQTPKPFSKKTIFFIVLLVTAILTLQSFIFIDQRLKEPLMHVARIRVKQVATETINRAISERVARNGEVQHLVDWQTNHDGNITGFMLNYGEHLKITSQIVSVVNAALKENVHLTEHVPIGQAINSPIFSTFGPSIPIRFESAGAPQVDLGTKREDAGINMLLVTVFVRVTTEVVIFIPFHTEPETVSTEIPISYILVKGDVPMYYFDAKGNPYNGLGGGAAVPPAVALPPPAGQVPEGSAPNPEGTSAVPR